MKRINNERGDISLLPVITTFIFLSVFVFMVNIMYLNLAKNEIQGIMDNSGVIALRYAVDETEWRLENIVVDKSIAKNKYRKLLSEQISAGPNNSIKKFDLVTLNVYGPDEVHRLGIAPGGGQGQYYLEAVANVSYRSSGRNADVGTNASNTFYNFFTNQEETRSNSGEVEDGEGELVIRSVSRLVLR